VLGAMTIDEKVAQLGYGMAMCESLNVTEYPHGIGGCMVGAASTGVATVKALRQALGASTRLGIPPSVYGETTHSGSAGGTTVFPMPCSQGASYNKTLVKAIAAANALELRSAGGDQALGPILQVATDPRFGRLEENFAEDPYLVAAYGVAAVQGLQGDDGAAGASTYVPDPMRHAVSQAKHYAMYAAGGRDGFTPLGGGVSERTLFEVYLRPWRDVMQQAGARGVMAAHNMIDWLPCHANKRMLTDVLRNRFGMRDGYIGSDCGNVEALFGSYTGFAESNTDAAVLAMEAGMDIDMCGPTFEALDEAVLAGTIANATLDRAVANVLRKKFAARLFDDAMMTPESSTVNINAPAHRTLALEAAREGTVLLRNVNNTLPVDASAIRNIAVVGPFGGCPKGANGTDCKTKIAMLGGYTAGLGDELHIRVVSVAEAFEERGFDVRYEQGSDGGEAGPGPADQAAAVAAAQSADLAVVVLGTMACPCCGNCANGEAGDRDSSFDPEGRQLELLAAVLEATAGSRTKVVGVLVHGRPMTFGGAAGDEHLLGSAKHPGLPALLAAWRPGEEGGTAIADLILGVVSPSAKLSQAWVRGPGAVDSPSNPWYQPPNPGGGNPPFGIAWRINGDNVPVSPLFPMGFGLTYTTFSFSDVGVDTTGAPAVGLNGTGLVNSTLLVKVHVTNTGGVRSKTPVIVTFSKLTRGVVRYIRMIAAFDKVDLAAGASTQLTVPVRVSDLARYDPEQPWHDLNGQPVRGAYVVDAGEYTFYVGDCVDNSGITAHPVRSAYPRCQPLNATVTLGVDLPRRRPASPPQIYGVYL